MRPFIFSFLFLLATASQAQSVTGSWYGVADVAAGGVGSNNYLTELIIKQKGDDVEGIFGYYFRDGYQSYFIRGKYNARTRTLIIPNVPITYFRSQDIDGIDCPMDFSATLMVSQVKSTLKGTMMSQKKYQYTCPQLRVSYAMDITEQNQDSLIKHTTAGTKKYWKPRNDELVISTKEPGATANTTPLTPKGEGPRTSPAGTDSLAKTDSNTVIVPVLSAKEAADTAAAQEKREVLRKLVNSYEQRKNVLSREIEIESDSVRISFYDNGDIDGDSISVFLNKYPVLTQQPLSAKSLNMYLAFDKGNDVAEISMYAENLGLYPPNTALMVITDGEKRYEVYMSSSLTQNATVRLKKKKSAMKVKQ